MLKETLLITIFCVIVLGTLWQQYDVWCFFTATLYLTIFVAWNDNQNKGTVFFPFHMWV